LLRPEFAKERASLVRRFGETDAHVLVTLGGGNTASLARLVVESLEQSSRPLEVRVVLGSAPVPDGLAQAALASRHRVQLLCGVRSMASKMVWADVSINAGGSTCWELACLGVPMLVAALSNDQAPNVIALEAEGAAVELLAPELAAHFVESLLAVPGRRRAMSRRGMALVDGLGAGRAAESLLAALEPQELARAAC
jgi:spore coat polysaccharide biosynthesis predicted glycosyltransferase SpsG